MKIGLIALSGIRACDQKLLELGLSLPGFVERSKAIASLPSLGLLTLAGMTPARHQVHYLEVEDLTCRDCLPSDFDLVAISSFSAQINEGYELAKQYTSQGVPVVMGGLHVTTRPQEPARCGASAVIGEGEPVWLEILEDAEARRLKPVYDARGREFDLADAPMPAYDLLDIERYNRITVQTSRGCPWRCGFCASSVLLTRKYKLKPVAKVLAEIDRIRNLWPRPFLEFADDNAFVNRRYWRELLPELAKRDLRWFAECDLSVHEDPELLALMREAGCVELLIGFESPVPQGLDGLETKLNWKRYRYEQYHLAVRGIQEAGIRVNACFVVGLDGHTPDIFDAVVDFVRETMPFDVQVTVPTPFPGTPFYRQLDRQDRLLQPEAWERCTLFDVNFRPSGMTVSELQAGLRRLVVELYADAFTKERKGRFHAQYRRAVKKRHPEERLPITV